MLGVVQPPAALVPRTSATGTTPDTLSFNSLVDSPVGRRFNQGIEGMAVTPDQKHLVTLLQSATEQDSTSAAVTRTNTRLMIYDITQTKTPTAPVADYVLQLPIYNTTGSGAAPNATAAQSELLALNDTQFLVLSRDANGLGLANNPPVFKSVLLVDVTGATNIAGTPFETSYTPISPGGNLVASITPVQQTEVVNILNSTQLAKFGINLINNPATRTTLTEKWEGMSLVPVLDEKAPQDFFLLVGNDDDFLASNCQVGGQNCAQSVNSDALVLTYRLTLPTYVDPQYLSSMQTTAPVAMAMTSLTARALASSPDIAQHLDVLRESDSVRPAQAADMDLSVWLGGGWSFQNESEKTVERQTEGATLGLDARLDPSLLVGAAVGYYGGRSIVAGGFAEDHDAVQVSAYGSLAMDGFYGDVTGTYSRQHFGDIARPGAYGLTASGSTNGDGYAVTGEIGFRMDSDDFRFGPVAGFRWMRTEIDGYSEAGASGGNVKYPGFDNSGVAGFFGGEISTALEGMRGIARIVYNTEDGYDDQTAIVSLVSAANVMGTQMVALPALEQGNVEPSLTLTGTGVLNWSIRYGAKIGVDAGVEHRVSVGLKLPL
jgi:hypothetical protein